MWDRWMRLAHKAAEVQAHVLFFLLYVFALVPMGLLQPGKRRVLNSRGSRIVPSWRTRERQSTDLASSRRQY
jgi:hypothetical protein